MQTSLQVRQWPCGPRLQHWERLSNTPFSAHRRNRLKPPFQSPDSLGRFRHGDPVRRRPRNSRSSRAQSSAEVRRKSRSDLRPFKPPFWKAIAPFGDRLGAAILPQLTGLFSQSLEPKEIVHEWVGGGSCCGVSCPCVVGQCRRTRSQAGRAFDRRCGLSIINGDALIRIAVPHPHSGSCRSRKMLWCRISPAGA